MRRFAPWLFAACLAAAATAATAVTQAGVQLDELTWTELRARIDAGATTALLPVGGTEQSGPHMALGKHNVRVRLLAVRIAERLGRRINEVAEMQRLSEGRFRQEWNDWIADDQKRWKQFTLTNDEAWRNHDKQLDLFRQSVEAVQAALDPLAVERADGCYLWDYDGKKHLDFCSQLMFTNLGYQNPKVVAAIAQQAATLCTIGPSVAVAAAQRPFGHCACGASGSFRLG